MYNINNEIAAFDKIILRSPLLSYEELFNSLTDLDALKNVYKKNALQEALFLASPVLHSALVKWLQGNLIDKKEIDKLIASLIRYLIRMSTRPTPFGLFAGCSICELGDESDIILNDLNTYKKHTRLDMFYLCNLAQDLAKNDFIKENLIYYPNSSIYIYGDQMRFIEYSFVNKKRMHHIVAIDNSKYLQKVLKVARKGAKIDELLDCLIDNEITIDEARIFIDDLISSQVLVNSLEPSITSSDFLDQIIFNLTKNQHPNITTLKNTLNKIEEHLAIIKNSSIGLETKQYLNLEEYLKKLQTPYELGMLFQVDMIKPTLKAKLSKRIIYDVWKGIEILSKLRTLPRQSNLTKFQSAFFDRYETREMPLLQVLDKENGIGYLQKGSYGDLSPLVDDLTLPNQEEEDHHIIWNNIESYLLKKYIEAIKLNAYEIELTDEELKSFKTDTENLSDTVACMFSVISSKIEINGNDRIHIISAGGSSAANLMGRFCHADEQILNLTRSITKKEQELNPDVILAEIIHLPESRIGNILLRPILREYEIPYLAKAGLDINHQISLDDLYLSIRNNRIYLRSKKLNKEVLPRLTSAHNFNFNSQPVYQFLCDMQTQGKKTGVSFHWGAFGNDHIFLPRVTYKNLILELATWNLKKEDFNELLSNSEVGLIKVTNSWRDKHKIPRFVSLADGDNELTIDMENLLSIKTLIDTIKKRTAIKLVEFLFYPENAIVKSSAGSYVNQFIVAFHKTKKGFSSSMFEETISTSTNVSRTFATGSEWLYYKFYSGNKTSDAILYEVIKPFTNYLLKEQLIDKWFFIRYNDPKEHIRVRFNIKNSKGGLLIDLLNAQIKQYLKQDLVWKIQTDTYQREIERYGENLIELTEVLFYNDSAAVVDLIDILNEYEGDNIRWLMALRSVDTFLNDFDFKLQDKLVLIEELKNSFGKEFGMNKSLKIQLDNKYRVETKIINETLDFIYSDEEPNDWKSFYQVFEKRSDLNKSVVEAIKMRANQLKLKGLMNSYLHMNINRIFKSRHRLHEMVIYDLLHRYYKSKSAREFKNKNRNNV